MTDERPLLPDGPDDLPAGFPKRPATVPPQDYFDKLPDHLAARWTREMALARRARQRRLSIAVAAMLAGIAVVWWRMAEQPAPEPLAGITPNEAYAYVMEHIDEFGDLIPEQAVLVPASGWLPEADTLSPDELLDVLSDDDLESMF
jgi:hypothetical protein